MLHVHTAWSTFLVDARVRAAEGGWLAQTHALPRSAMAGEDCAAGHPLLAPWRQQEVHPVAAAHCAAGTWRRFSARPVPDSDAGGRQSRALPRPTHGGEPGTARRSPRPPRDPGEGRPRSHVHTRSPAHTRDRLQAAKSTWLSTSFAHERYSRRLRGVSTARCATRCNYAISACPAGCNSGLWHGHAQRSRRGSDVTRRHDQSSRPDNFPRMRLCEVRTAGSKPKK